MSGTDNPYGGSFANAGYGAQVTTGGGSGKPASGNSATPPAGGNIKDTTTAAFARDVLQESAQQPVLVDFWAPWCGPCRQLTPILEKVVNEAGGKVKLVKMNIDDHPSIAGQLGVQSIPAVVAFVGGRPVDAFMGAVPESEIRAFIARLGGEDAGAGQAAEIEAVLGEAEALVAGGDGQRALQLYGAVLQADPENIRAAAGLLQVLVSLGETDQAAQFLASLPEELRNGAEIQAVAKTLEQIAEARKLGDPAALERRLAEAPDDHAARLNLAKIRNAEGRREDAAEHLLTIMRSDREFDDDGARRQLLEFFEAWGPKDKATISARRRLSSILFS